MTLRLVQKPDGTWVLEDDQKAAPPPTTTLAPQPLELRQVEDGSWKLLPRAPVQHPSIAPPPAMPPSLAQPSPEEKPPAPTENPAMGILRLAQKASDTFLSPAITAGQALGNLAGLAGTGVAAGVAGLFSDEAAQDIRARYWYNTQAEAERLAAAQGDPNNPYTWSRMLRSAPDLGQMLSESISPAPGQKESFTGQRALATALGFGASLVTDPLTYTPLNFLNAAKWSGHLARYAATGKKSEKLVQALSTAEEAAERAGVAHRALTATSNPAEAIRAATFELARAEKHARALKSFTASRPAAAAGAVIGAASSPIAMVGVSPQMLNMAIPAWQATGEAYEKGEIWGPEGALSRGFEAGAATLGAALPFYGAASEGGGLRTKVGLDVKGPGGKSVVAPVSKEEARARSVEALNKIAEHAAKKGQWQVEVPVPGRKGTYRTLSFEGEFKSELEGESQADSIRRIIATGSFDDWEKTFGEAVAKNLKYLKAKGSISDIKIGMIDPQVIQKRITEIDQEVPPDAKPLSLQGVEKEGDLIVARYGRGSFMGIWELPKVPEPGKPEDVRNPLANPMMKPHTKEEWAAVRRGPEGAKYISVFNPDNTEQRLYGNFLYNGWDISRVPNWDLKAQVEKTSREGTLSYWLDKNKDNPGTPEYQRAVNMLDNIQHELRYREAKGVIIDTVTRPRKGKSVKGVPLRLYALKPPATKEPGTRKTKAPTVAQKSGRRGGRKIKAALVESYRGRGAGLFLKKERPPQQQGPFLPEEGPNLDPTLLKHVLPEEKEGPYEPVGQRTPEEEAAYYGPNLEKPPMSPEAEARRRQIQLENQAMLDRLEEGIAPSKKMKQRLEEAEKAAPPPELPSEMPAEKRAKVDRKEVAFAAQQDVVSRALYIAGAERSVPVKDASGNQVIRTDPETGIRMPVWRRERTKAGILDSFGSMIDRFPSLAEDPDIHARIDAYRKELDDLAKKTTDPVATKHVQAAVQAIDEFKASHLKTPGEQRMPDRALSPDTGAAVLITGKRRSKTLLGEHFVYSEHGKTDEGETGRLRHVRMIGEMPPDVFYARIDGTTHIVQRLGRSADGRKWRVRILDASSEAWKPDKPPDFKKTEWVAGRRIKTIKPGYDLPKQETDSALLDAGEKWKNAVTGETKGGIAVAAAKDAAELRKTPYTPETEVDLMRDAIGKGGDGGIYIRNEKDKILEPVRPIIVKDGATGKKMVVMHHHLTPLEETKPGVIKDTDIGKRPLTSKDFDRTIEALPSEEQLGGAKYKPKSLEAKGETMAEVARNLMREAAKRRTRVRQREVPVVPGQARRPVPKPPDTSGYNPKAHEGVVPGPRPSTRVGETQVQLGEPRTEYGARAETPWLPEELQFRGKDAGVQRGALTQYPELPRDVSRTIRTQVAAKPQVDEKGNVIAYGRQGAPGPERTGTVREAPNTRYDSTVVMKDPNTGKPTEYAARIVSVDGKRVTIQYYAPERGRYADFKANKALDKEVIATSKDPKVLEARRRAWLADEKAAGRERPADTPLPKDEYLRLLKDIRSQLVRQWVKEGTLKRGFTEKVGIAYNEITGGALPGGKGSLGGIVKRATRADMLTATREGRYAKTRPIGMTWLTTNVDMSKLRWVGREGQRKLGLTPEQVGDVRPLTVPMPSAPAKAPAPAAKAVPTAPPPAVPTARSGTKAFTLVASRGNYDVSGMRGLGGTKHMNSVKPEEYGLKDSGWLGNPYKWEGNGGPKGVTVDDVIARFEKDFLAKVDSDQAFRNAVLELRGKRIGYYAPDSPKNHLQVVDKWLREHGDEEVTPTGKVRASLAEPYLSERARELGFDEEPDSARDWDEPAVWRVGNFPVHGSIREQIDHFKSLGFRVYEGVGTEARMDLAAKRIYLPKGADNKSLLPIQAELSTFVKPHIDDFTALMSAPAVRHVVDARTVIKEDKLASDLVTRLSTEPNAVLTGSPSYALQGKLRRPEAGTFHDIDVRLYDSSLDKAKSLMIRLVPEAVLGVTQLDPGGKLRLGYLVPGPGYHIEGVGKKRLATGEFVSVGVKDLYVVDEAGNKVLWTGQADQSVRVVDVFPYYTKKPEGWNPVQLTNAKGEKISVSVPPPASAMAEKVRYRRVKDISDIVNYEPGVAANPLDLDFQAALRPPGTPIPARSAQRLTFEQIKEELTRHMGWAGVEQDRIEVSPWTNPNGQINPNKAFIRFYGYPTSDGTRRVVGEVVLDFNKQNLTVSGRLASHGGRRLAPGERVRGLTITPVDRKGNEVSGRRIIQLAMGEDVSTLHHELGHVFWDFAGISDAEKRALSNVIKVPIDPSTGKPKYTFEEAFVQAYEKWRTAPDTYRAYIKSKLGITLPASDTKWGRRIDRAFNTLRNVSYSIASYLFPNSNYKYNHLMEALFKDIRSNRAWADRDLAKWHLNRVLDMHQDLRNMTQKMRDEYGGILDDIMQTIHAATIGTPSSHQEYLYKRALTGTRPWAIMAAENFSAIRHRLTPRVVEGITNKIDLPYGQAPSYGKRLTSMERSRALTALRKLRENLTPLQDNEIEVLRRVVGGQDREVQAAIDAHQALVGMWDYVEHYSKPILGGNAIAKALSASWDSSAILRQGLLGTIRNPVIAAKAFKATMKSIRNEEFAHGVMDQISSSTDMGFKAGAAEITDLEMFTRYGLEINDWRAGASDVTRAEQFSGVPNWVRDKVPGVHASDRIYATYLNKLRFDMAKKHWKALEDMKLDRRRDANAYRAMMDYINTATGFGDMARKYKKMGQKEAEVISGIGNAIFGGKHREKFWSKVLWSPRFFESRLSLMNPANLGLKVPFTELQRTGRWGERVTGSEKASSYILKEHRRSLAALTTTVFMLGALKSMVSLTTDDEDERKQKSFETNPLSSDWMKLFFGSGGGKKKWRLDVMGGLQQYAVLAARAAFGMRKTAAGKMLGTDDYGSQASPESLVVDRLSKMTTPLIRVMSQVALGESATGAEVPNPVMALALGDPRTAYLVTRQMLLESLTPMSMQDLNSMMDDVNKGNLDPGSAAILILAGQAGASVYKADFKQEARKWTRGPIETLTGRPPELRNPSKKQRQREQRETYKLLETGEKALNPNWWMSPPPSPPPSMTQ